LRERIRSTSIERVMPRSRSPNATTLPLHFLQGKPELKPASAFHKLTEARKQDRFRGG
jgi:hypothetical protein